MLNVSCESEHIDLVPDFREQALSFLPLSMLLAIADHIWALLC